MTRVRVHVGLARSINVGGKNRLPMKALATIFSEVGAANVTTYIQSGNLIFTASAEPAKHIPGE